MIRDWRIRGWWAVLMVLVVAVGLALAGISYTAHAQRRSDARWCELMVLLDRPRPDPPATPEAARIREKFHDLRLDLGCGP